SFSAAPCEKQEEADTKETMFHIIYVQRSDEDGGHPAHQSKEAPLPSSSSEQLKAETDTESATEHSDDEWRNSEGVPSGTNKRKPPQACESGRPYTCSICNKNFRIKSVLARHMKMHTGDKPYSCSVCGKSFVQRSYLKTHLNSHSGQKPYTCSICGRGFTQPKPVRFGHFLTSLVSVLLDYLCFFFFNKQFLV
uniref:C2H2-type domain-containing protein n=1 Tax=Anabas testudineus TaxID=64144 RepID=A0A3Q1KBA6_ANATE